MAEVGRLRDALEEARDLLERYHAEWGCLSNEQTGRERCDDHGNKCAALKEPQPSDHRGQLASYLSGGFV